MATDSEIRSKFWKGVKAERTIMLGLIDDKSGHSQPMTALIEDDEAGGPIWIFSSKETDFVRSVGSGARVMAQFVSKGHDLFACFNGDIIPNNDRAMIDRLWSPFVAAWFEGGKEDPKLQLLQLDPGEGHVWLSENSLFAGVRMLLGRDPKQDYEGKTADVDLSERRPTNT